MKNTQVILTDRAVLNDRLLSAFDLVLSGTSELYNNSQINFDIEMK